jgi:hypothetical protein
VDTTCSSLSQRIRDAVLRNHSPSLINGLTEPEILPAGKNAAVSGLAWLTLLQYALPFSFSQFRSWTQIEIRKLSAEQGGHTAKSKVGVSSYKYD